MSVTATGTMTADGVHFERIYDATADELWAAITDPEQIGGWLANVTRWSLTPGESWGIRFGDGAVNGRVVAVDPGRRLELTWVEESGMETFVALEVVPREAGSLLVLDHSRLDPERRPGYGAGWQSHLEALDRLLHGGAELDWWALYNELRPKYVELAAS